MALNLLDAAGDGLQRFATARRTRAAWRLLALVALIAAAAAASWAWKARDNAVIAEARALAAAPGTEPERLVPEIAFAQAHELAVALDEGAPAGAPADAPADVPADAGPSASAPAKAAAPAGRADRLEPALARYRALYGDARLGVAARYNSANMLLRQALRLRDGDNPGQALPLIELAKQGYREALRRDPANWDARYNFERAQRAQPDPDEIDAPIGEPRAQSERSPTTTRGVGGGLP